MTSLLGAIAFDPNIRGILICVVAVVVLPGSIYMILATNSGARSGFLIAGAGVFGWMFLMGIFWWMYGIGLKGRAAAWMPHEINYDRGSPAATAELAKLPDPATLPNPVELLNSHPLVRAFALASEGSEFTPKTLSNIVTLATPMVQFGPHDVSMNRANLEKNSQAVVSQSPETAQILAGSDASVATALSKEAREVRAQIEDKLGGWCLLSESDPRRGEAASASDAALVAKKAFGDPTTSANYIVQDVYFYGGKEPCAPITEESTIKQAWHRIATTVEVKNPKLLAAVTVVEAKQFAVAPGQTPPPPTKMENASAVTVTLVRNLGNVRFIPFLFALLNGVMFAIFVIILHSRDKAVQQHLAAAEAAKNKR
jgi:hypothetical protein